MPRRFGQPKRKRRTCTPGAIDTSSSIPWLQVVEGSKRLEPRCAIVPSVVKITVETVDHVSRLARLQLDQDERQTFARQLGQVLDYAESIQAIDTSNVEPMSHAGTAGLMREDTVRPGLDRQKALDAAPDTDAGLF